MELEEPGAPENAQADSGGGAHVDGDAQVSDGGFLGRDQHIHGDQVYGDKKIVHGDEVLGDKIVNNINNFIQQATSAAEEAEKARSLALRRLAEGVKAYAQRLAKVAVDDADAGGPYKGLLAYRLGDAGRFFGRDRAIADLLEHMGQGRLTILQAESGAGKSSLLQAGISPRLLAAGHLPVHVRPYNRSPSLKIKQEFLPDLAQTPELAEAPLGEFLRRVTEVLGPSTTLYLLVDQFEEFFTRLTDEAQRQAFVDDLAACLEDESLNVRWVLAVRKDYFGDLDTLQPQIPNPYANRYRLNRLARDQARDVVVRPVARLGIDYEPALVERLLDDLEQEDDEIDPPQIQLVCRALYQQFEEQRAADPDLPPTITLDMYEKRGGAEEILGGYLDKELKETLPTGAQRRLAWQLLEALVSADQRRMRRTHAELAEALITAVEAGQSRGQILRNLDPVLEQLIESRLLNVGRDDETGRTSYELAHDYLLNKIEIAPEVKAHKAAQEMLDQEVAAWRNNQKLRIPEDKLDIIEAQEAKLVLHKEAKTLLQLSRQALERRKRFVLAGGVVSVLLAVFAAASILAAVGASQLADQAQDNLATAEAAVVAANFELGQARQERAGAETAVAMATAELGYAYQRQVEAEAAAATADASRIRSELAAAAAETRLQAANRALRLAFLASGVVPVGGGPLALAHSGTRLWVADYDDNKVRSVDPQTGIVDTTIDVDAGPSALAFDGERLWVASALSNTVQALDPGTGEILETVSVDPAPDILLLVGERLWIKNANSIQALDTRTRQVTEPIAVCCDLRGLALAGARLWTYAQNALVEIDPARGEIERYYLDEQLLDELFLEEMEAANLEVTTAAVLLFDGRQLWIAAERIRTLYHPDLGLSDVWTSGFNVYAWSPQDNSFAKVLESDLPLPRTLFFDGDLVWAADFGRIWAVDPTTGFVTEPMAVGRNPSALLLDGAYLWIANRSSNTVQRVPLDDVLFQPVPVGQNPCGLAHDGQHLWVANQGDNTVQRVQWPAPSQPISVGVRPCAMAFDGDHLWVANQDDDTLQVLAPQTGEMVGTLAVGRSPNDLAYDGRRMWLTHDLDTALLGIDTDSLAIEYTLEAAYWHHMQPHLDFDGTYLWVAIPDGILKIDPAAPDRVQTLGGMPVSYALLTSVRERLWYVNRYVYLPMGDLVSLDPGTQATEVALSESIRFRTAPSALAFDGQRLWLAVGDTIQARDPATGVLGATVQVGRNPRALLFDGQRLWIANGGDNTVQYLFLRRER